MTSEDVRRLFERYRMEARLFAQASGEPETRAEPAVPEPDEPLVASR